MTTTRITRRFTLEDQARGRYVRVPFRYRGAGSFEVRLTYERQDGAAVVDLGCEGPDGWRGWSGGARESYVVTETDATPGYVGGSLDMGEWAVVLGLHRVPADGVDVVVEIQEPSPRDPERDVHPPVPTDRPPRRNLPADDGLTWYAGDFHAHSRHSDGSLPLSHLVAAAARDGLDFLAITEHNTVSHHPLLPGLASEYGIGLIPGQEVTTHRGHANAYGDIGFVDFRQPPKTWRARCDARGGLLSVNHPLQDDCGWQYAELGHALELWHITWFLDLTATGPWALWRRWDQTLPIIGGSDFHTPDQGYPLATPTTWVAAESPEPDAILDAVRAGRTAITQRPTGPALLRAGGDLLAIDADGTVAVDLEGRRHAVRGDRATFPGGFGDGGLVRLVDARGRMLGVC